VISVNACLYLGGHRCHIFCWFSFSFF